MILEWMEIDIYLALLLQENTEKENHDCFKDWISRFRDQQQGTAHNHYTFLYYWKYCVCVLDVTEGGDILIKDAKQYKAYDDLLHVPANIVKMWIPPHNGACGYLCVGAALGLAPDQYYDLLQTLIAAMMEGNDEDQRFSRRLATNMNGSTADNG
jgi:hypothetical protein